MTSAEARERLQCSGAENKKKRKRRQNCTVKRGRVRLCVCVCVCSHSDLSMNSPAGVFPNRARPPTDRMKDGVTERRDRKRGGGGEGADVEM